MTTKAITTKRTSPTFHEPKTRPAVAACPALPLRPACWPCPLLTHSAHGPGTSSCSALHAIRSRLPTLFTEFTFQHEIPSRGHVCNSCHCPLPQATWTASPMATSATVPRPTGGRSGGRVCTAEASPGARRLSTRWWSVLSPLRAAPLSAGSRRRFRSPDLKVWSTR
ncbi:hypothetical protein HJG60_012143 [Phyllostomus discolor]|uniref:Uncharacterized protein n=1 Tax=Phyllostomus discolor TaxID=89673 RepID=A0A833ZQ96_9CHIR|nr:hypothetical protein HJG60_012143 [Phyllostomus discolor]